MEKLWEKQPHETMKAFVAFCIYRDMPPYERSLDATGKVLDRNLRQMEQWSSKYDWVNRVGAWDGFRDQQMEKRRLAAWGDFNTNLEKYASALIAKAAGRLRQIDEAEIPASMLSRWAVDALKIYRDLRGEPSTTIKHEVAVEKMEHQVALEIEEFLRDTDYEISIEDIENE